MEFFEYVAIPQYIMQFIRGGASGGISLNELFILFAVAGGAYFVCLIIGGLALFTMAERAGIKHSWMGFIPFVNTYYAGKVAGETSFFGKKMKHAGLYAMIAEIVYCVLEIFSTITSVMMSNPAYYETNYTGNSSTLLFDVSRVPAGLQWMAGGSTWFSALGMLANLVMLLLLCVVYSAIFRKYSPKSGFILTVISVLLPIRGFVLFGVRNNAPFDYDAYMKERIEQAMRSAGVNAGEIKPADEPFSDFTAPPASPFSEFDDGTPYDPPSDADGHTDHSGGE